MAQITYNEGDKMLIAELVCGGFFEVHTNFDLTQHRGLGLAIEAVYGVEQVFITKRYEITVFVGKCFDLKNVADNVSAAILRYITE